MRRTVAIVLAAVPVVSLLAQQAPVYKAKEEKLPLAVALQPIAYSHKKHVGLGMRCLECHKGAAEKDQAGLPGTALCIGCHATIKAESPEIRKLAEFHKRGEQPAWVRIYRVPGFVFFSHASHVKAGEQCVTCHGPVQERDVLAKEVSTGMIACMNCHAARKVSNDCVLCHQLSF
jgi:predicted CXXCH cytochrome family protein